MPTIDRKEINKIKELYASRKRKSLVGDTESGVSDQRIRPYENNGAVVRKFFKKLRGGMAAGNKDTNVLGEPESKKEGSLNDIPKFTPFNCNFFKQTISATDQAKITKSGKDNEAPRLTSDKVNPLFNAKSFKKFIN